MSSLFGIEARFGWDGHGEEKLVWVLAHVARGMWAGGNCGRRTDLANALMPASPIWLAERTSWVNDACAPRAELGFQRQHEDRVGRQEEGVRGGEPSRHGRAHRFARLSDRSHAGVANAVLHHAQGVEVGQVVRARRDPSAPRVADLVPREDDLLQLLRLDRRQRLVRVSEFGFGLG